MNSSRKRLFYRFSANISVTMSSAQHLRDFIRERLTAAAEEIFTEVEKTIICYEEQLDAQRRMMGINWKPQIKLNRIGSELQRQSSDIQNPHVSVKEEAATVQERRSSHEEDEAESQFTDTLVKVISSNATEEEQMEPEPPLTEEHWEPGSIWIKEEEEEAQSPVFNFEQQEPEPEPEPLPTRQNQKHVCSSQEGEQLDQKQFAALMETFTLQRRDLSDGEPSERLSFSPEAESRDQEGSSSTVSENQSHTDTRTGPFSCGVCGRLLKNKYDLKQHYMTHTGEKPFTCETCSKSFARRSQLNVHYRTHTGERPFTCPICKKSFFQIGHLNVHKNIHTGVRPFSCETCGKSFTRRYLLNIHRRSHMGERPFSWESFMKSF